MIKHSMNFDSSSNKWIVLLEHEFNERVGEFKKTLGECLYHLPDKLNPRDAVKGGRTKVFHMHIVVCNPNRKMIRYLDVNSLYPFVMSMTKFPVGHPLIRHGDHSCRNLLRELKSKGQSFIRICSVRVLAPKKLMVPYLPHKIDGKQMFFLCRSCSLNGNIQCNPCHHTNLEQNWLDMYTSIDMQVAEKIGYRILEYYELWHYSKGGIEFFKDFILNIVR